MRKWIMVLAVAAAITAGALASPLFYDSTVDESLPAALDRIQEGLTIEEFEAMDELPRSSLVAGMPDSVKQMIMDEAAKSQRTVSEEMDESGQVRVILAGQFVGLAGHSAEGDAKVVRVGSSEYLRFEDFRVTNGPDLRVYLTQDGDVSRGIHLEKLKGNVGSQNYLLDGIDADTYRTVVIYCQPFGAYFGEAMLDTA